MNCSDDDVDQVKEVFEGNQPTENKPAPKKEVKTERLIKMMIGQIRNIWMLNFQIVEQNPYQYQQSKYFPRRIKKRKISVNKKKQEKYGKI